MDETDSEDFDSGSETEVEEYSSEENLAEKFKKSIEKAIDSKLQELNPEDVKVIIEKMIRAHLGWLIVWGGVFGGLFGLIFSLIRYF